MVLGALADDTVIIQTEALRAMNQDCQLISSDQSWSIHNHTAGEGPIIIGVASSDLTVTEIKEAIQAAPVSATDVPAIEHAKRRVRTIGQFPGLNTDEVLMNGMQVRTRFPILRSAEQSWPQFWAFQKSGAPLTTGTVVIGQGKQYGRWK